MYNHIGNKLKSIARIIAAVGIVLCTGFGISFIVQGNGNVVQSLAGIAIAVLGSAISWASTVVLYGFGQLIENSDKILERINWLEH